MFCRNISRERAEKLFASITEEALTRASVYVYEAPNRDDLVVCRVNLGRDVLDPMDGRQGLRAYYDMKHNWSCGPMVYFPKASADVVIAMTHEDDYTETPMQWFGNKVVEWYDFPNLRPRFVSPEFHVVDESVWACGYDYSWEVM